MLWLSDSRCVDRLWIAVDRGDESEALFRRVEEALCLIKTYDRIRHERLTRDLERVWVGLLPGAEGSFNKSDMACYLDTRFVRADTTLPEMIASTIVHEATHARLVRRGIGYEEKLRPRGEAACVRRELAFAAKLPHGDKVRERAEHALEFCIARGHEFLTDGAIRERRFEGGVEALRHLGVPRWLVRAMVALTAPQLRVRRLIPGRRSVLRLLDRLWPLIVAVIIVVIVIIAVRMATGLVF
jgi:hypothetical protein